MMKTRSAGASGQTLKLTYNKILRRDLGKNEKKGNIKLDDEIRI
jgi:hypothetical protein